MGQGPKTFLTPARTTPTRCPLRGAVIRRVPPDYTYKVFRRKMRTPISGSPKNRAPGGLGPGLAWPGLSKRPRASQKRPNALMGPLGPQKTQKRTMGARGHTPLSWALWALCGPYWGLIGTLLGSLWALCPLRECRRQFTLVLGKGPLFLPQRGIAILGVCAWVWGWGRGPRLSSHLPGLHLQGVLSEEQS